MSNGRNTLVYSTLQSTVYNGIALRVTITYLTLQNYFTGSCDIFRVKYEASKVYIINYIVNTVKYV